MIHRSYRISISSFLRNLHTVFHSGYESESGSIVSDSLCPLGLYSPWEFSRREYWSGSLLQGIFPTQGTWLNPGLLHWRWILYQLNHKGSPRILDWVACPFSSGSSGPRNRTRVSCIAGGFFTSWAIREAQVAQLCPTLCNPMDYTVRGVLQTGILEWVAFPFSKES